MTADAFQSIALDTITPSTTNPRRHFDETKLAELATVARRNAARKCRVCGRAENSLWTGVWVEDDLCSACEDT